MGLLSLRRRKETTTGAVIYEIKLDEDFLMSSFFTVAEIALSNLGLAASSHPELDVVVGGLGLGYTAISWSCDIAVYRDALKAATDRTKKAVGR